MVDMLVKIAPKVYSPYVTTNKKGERILLVQCMDALYGSMVASLMFYKKLASALKLYGFSTIRTTCTWPTRLSKVKY